MSGSGPTSPFFRSPQPRGSWAPAAGSAHSPAEHHLGDRLAALVDGELTHDARDRVLAHLATCPRCKAEADAQRMLKDVFARSAPPPPSAGLLARLQGLPAGPGRPGSDLPGGPGGDRGGPFGGRAPDTLFGTPLPAAGGRRPAAVGYLPGGHGSRPGAPLGGFGAGAAPSGRADGRPDADRSPWRGRRFAFAAASAVSFAAIALGGSMPTDGSSQAGSRSGGTGSGGTPVRAASSAGTAVGGQSQGSGAGISTSAATTRATEYERRRNSGFGPTRSEGRVVGRSAAEPEVPLNLASRPVPTALNAAFPAFPAFKAPPAIRPMGFGFHLGAPHGFLPPVLPDPSAAPGPGAGSLPTHHIGASPGPVANAR
ncbi:zf-HC2 domain-containing protein [Streptomyces sp. NPDC006798]|uniref:anti-sigma factor family protein n=1 Tax=Streptomyces sp. NPDC006798 TaxID=3155462 RepID=UPI0033EBE749